MIAYGYPEMDWIIKENGHDITEYEIVFEITKEEKNLYFAFNKDTSDEIIGKFQKALDEVKKEGLYDKIISKYLKK